MYHPDICLEVIRKTTENLSQHSCSLVRDLNLEPPKYEAGVLTTRSRYSVTVANDIKSRV
jgi:hypothetical protein